MATSTKDMDSKFLEAISSMKFDLEGELAVKFTGSCEYFRPYENLPLNLNYFSCSARTFPIHGMDGEFIRMDGDLFGRRSWYAPARTRDPCTDDCTVDWTSYSEVLQVSSRIMDTIAYRVTTLSRTEVVRLPIVVAEGVQDSKYVLQTRVSMSRLTSCNFRSTLRAISSWLDDPAWMRVSSNVLIDVQSYETSGAGVYNDHREHVMMLLKDDTEFSITDFSFRLPQLLSATLGIKCGRVFHTSVYVLKEEYDDLFKQFRGQLRSENDALIESRTMRNSRLLFKRPLPPSNSTESQR